MSKPRLQAPRFATITDADWAREIKAARARGIGDGIGEGNAIVARIRAAVAETNFQMQDANLRIKKPTTARSRCENRAQ